MIQSSETHHPVASVTMTDNFIVRVGPAQGLTLEQCKTMMVQQTKQIEKTVAEVKKQFGPPKVAVDVTKDAHQEFKPTSIGKIPAYEIITRNVLTVEGSPIKMQSRAILTLFHDRVYIVTAGFESDREKKVKPIADAFLASLRVDAAR